MLGWDMSAADIRERGILGFALGRFRQSDGETSWMTGTKTFQSVDPDPGLGVRVSSFKHPFQSFQWADYSAEPGKEYTYRVVAMKGAPGGLVPDADVSLTVTTERVDQGKHAIYFNRGAIASQEYARRFQNRAPSEVGEAAYTWLSRGLIEGLETYIGLAGPGDALHGAFFEFQSSRVFAALKRAKARGADVLVLYDADAEREDNEEALEGSGIKRLVKPRTRSGQFAHNKFLVLSKSGKPAEVWTGSTNLTENGIFGHSNNAHIVRDDVTATAFERYFDILRADKSKKPTAAASAKLSPVPPQPWSEIVPVFSPRPDLDALDWYAELAGGATRALMTTFAFGMNERFVPIYERSDSVLRFALMEKKGNGSAFKKQAAEVDRIRKKPNTVVAVGNNIRTNAFDRWLAEIDRVKDAVNVRFVHTKYMLIDPLGPSPVVIVGSANFSKASTDTNDENMLVIKGNASVADVYIGEFMRLFSHYAYRESLTFKGSTSEKATPKRKYLEESTSWINDKSGYYTPGTDRMLRRLYFSGQ
jgi:phosphatidylserine/phosphatidylglycerophosphate/cardiolipin synthase-like enzyme